MSRAEELAQKLADMTSKHKAPSHERGVLNGAVEELRRLAQVEAEHAALLKAISDAEPVAWLVCSVNKDKSLSLEHAAPWKEAAHEHINDAINEYGLEEAASWIVREVYTLNGIKKP